MNRYVFAIRMAGVPLKPVLYGSVNRINISRDAEVLVRNKLREARENGAKLVYLEAEEEYNNDAIREYLASFTREEFNQFLSENQIVDDYRRKNYGKNSNYSKRKRH